MRTKLSYSTFGQSTQQAIMMIPGWAMPKETMFSLAQALSIHYYVIVVDLPGVSLQEVTPTVGINYDIDALTGRLLDIAPQNCWWIGWSLGGMIATYIAARRSSRAKGVITIASTPSFLIREGWPHGMPVETFEAFAQLVAQDPSKGLQRFVALQTRGATQVKKLVRELSVYRTVKSCSSALNGGLRLLSGLDVRRELMVLDRPNLHILGCQDALVSALAWQTLDDDNPCRQINYIADCTHQPFLEAPDVTVDLIERFIDAH